jgi:hypothetical protein
MSTGQRVARKCTSTLDALTAAEKGQLLDELLTARPELREHAEALAMRRMLAEDRSTVADDVESALGFHDIDELNGRAGYHPGRGYVDPGEAADEILDEALQPFLSAWPDAASSVSRRRKSWRWASCGDYTGAATPTRKLCWSTHPTIRSSVLRTSWTNARGWEWRCPSMIFLS